MSHCFHFCFTFFNNNWTHQIHIKYLFWVVIENITDFVTTIFKCQSVNHFQLKFQKTCRFEVEDEDPPIISSYLNQEDPQL